jgi:hypothetical protein
VQQRDERRAQRRVRFLAVEAAKGSSDDERLARRSKHVRVTITTTLAHAVQTPSLRDIDDLAGSTSL